MSRVLAGLLVTLAVTACAAQPFSHPFQMDRKVDVAALAAATARVMAMDEARKAATILGRFSQVYPGWPVHGAATFAIPNMLCTMEKP